MPLAIGSHHQLSPSVAEFTRAAFRACTKSVNSVDVVQRLIIKRTRDPKLKVVTYIVKFEEEGVEAVRRALEGDPGIDGETVATSMVAGMTVLRRFADRVCGKQSGTADALYTVEGGAEYSAARENALEGGADWVVNQLNNTGWSGDT